jgi:cytoskeletal protein CcmA (bactofilin family)
MTTIGESLVITGELACDEDLLIDGRVKGLVTMRGGTLTVTEHARLDSDVRAARVVVRGHIRGNIFASERIELHASASVSGSLSANQVVIADGAVFQGGIDMGQRTIAAKVAQYKARQG